MRRVSSLTRGNKQVFNNGQDLIVFPHPGAFFFCCDSFFVFFSSSGAAAAAAPPRTLRLFFARQQLTHLKLGHGRLSRPRAHLFISVPILSTKSDCGGGGGGARALRVHSWAPFGFVCKGSDHTLRPLDRQLFQVEDLTAHSQ